MKKSHLFVLALFIFACPGGAQPVVDYLHINAQVNNGYAITTVEEKLTNGLDISTEDQFKFLIPDEAFISGFSLIIDGKEYKADVLRKKEAQEKFEEAVSQGRSAGLLESRNRNLFSYSLSFAPRQSIIVRLKYEQAVKKSLGKYEYVLYLRETDTSHTLNDISVNLSISSVNDITTLETPGFTGASVKYLSTALGRVTYSANSMPDKDLTVVFTTDNPPLNGDMLFYSSGGQGYMMHVFSPDESDLGTTALSKDIVFVLDKSGSMKGEKIEQVKKVFTKIISDLPPDDNFNVIFFDSSIRTYSNMLMEADTKNKSDAANFVNSLDAEGGTDINQALLTAVGMFTGDSKRVPIIVFLTDGEPTIGVTSPYVIRKNIKDANKASVSIFTIAFGIENEANYDFLKALSLENYGKAQRFFLEGKVEEEMSDFYKTISTPLITDMGFNYDTVSDIVNTGQNNLFAGSDAVVLGKYSGSVVTSNIAATTRTGSKNFRNSFNAVSKPENSFIPRLWAYTKIKKLMDRIDVEGETDTLVSSVTAISLELKFVTPYTSLFVEIPKNATKKTVTAIGAKAESESAGGTSGQKAPAATGTPPLVYVTPAATHAVDMVYATAAATSTAKPTAVATYAAKPAVTQTAAPPSRAADQVQERKPAETAAPKEPGFEVLFTVIGLIGVRYIVVRKRS